MERFSYVPAEFWVLTVWGFGLGIPNHVSETKLYKCLLFRSKNGENLCPTREPQLFRTKITQCHKIRKYIPFLSSLHTGVPCPVEEKKRLRYRFNRLNYKQHTLTLYFISPLFSRTQCMVDVEEGSPTYC